MLFKFGAEKSRMYMLGLIGIPMMLIIWITSFYQEQALAIINGMGAPLIVITLIIVAMCLLITSYCIALNVVSKRDY